MYNLQLSVDLPPIGLSIAYFLNNKKKLYGVERLVAIQNLITSTFVYLHYFNYWPVVIVHVYYLVSYFYMYVNYICTCTYLYFIHFFVEYISM
jgi:hypothetical protein